MTTDYGTGMTGKENLSGYFDVNNEGVSIKEGKPIKSWRFWSKKKKILVIGGAIFVVLLLLIIIIAATARHKKESGKIPSLSSGQACTGDTTKQNQCRSGKCLENLFICDGFKDCEDGEDEIKALCDEFSRKPRCRVKQFQCKVSRQCIDTEQVCNGKLDCGSEEYADFSDERNCFEINPDNSVVSVIQNGVSMPMSADIGDLESYIICKEMGFRSLKSRIGIPANGEEIQQCGNISKEFNPEEGDDINDFIDTVDDCSNGILTLVCEKDLCGVFGEYTGPVIPPSWMSPDLAEALRKSDTEFPWVVSIHQKEKKCQGAIVDEEWVITSINCVDHKHFYTNFEEDALTVVAGEGTSSRQSRNVYKVIRNHFEAVSGLSPYDNVILLQVFPPFELSPSTHQVCLQQPALLPHYNCFAAGYNAETKKTEHVRVVLETDESNCGSEELRNGTACFNYPHSGKSKACLDSVGSPISCLDPVTNSWTLSAILSTKIGCGINKRQALHFDQMPVYYWANIITSLPEEITPNCEGLAQFQKVRVSKGIREDQYYVDVLGWGEYEAWYTVYNLSSAFGIIAEKLDQWDYTPYVRLIKNDTGVTNKNVAVMDCPSSAEDMCSCEIKYVSYHASMKEADVLHFVDDTNEDGRVDDSDYDSELWDYDNTDGLDADQLSQDYAEGITLDEVLPTGEALQCPKPELTGERLCADNSSCIRSDSVCDSFSDCKDNSDEERDICEKYHGYRCPAKWFKCRTTYDCQPWTARCDGNQDCLDGSDEHDCVRVMDDETVYVEKYGLSLPLSGLPSQVSDETETQLGILLCQIMGYGQFVNLSTIDSSEREFPQGCYKLDTESDGEKLLVYTDFERYKASVCNTTFKIVCGRLRCGTTIGAQGPERPAGWPADPPSILPVANTVNRDYPWVVHVMRDNVPLCSATIIQPDWVVTSANCLVDLASDLTVEFTDVSSETKIHNVVRKVDYFSLVNQEEPERNVSLLAVNPPFDFSSISHPLCVIPPLYIPESYCTISGRDTTTNAVVHVRVKLREADECRDTGVGSQWDNLCVEVIPTVLDVDSGKTDVDGCIITKGSSLQCLDGLRKRYSFAAVITQNIGKNCTDETESTMFPVAANMTSMLDWLMIAVEELKGLENITCSDEGEEAGSKHLLTFRSAHYLDEWYITTDKGVGVKWDNTDTLGEITAKLIEFFGSGKVTSTEGGLGNTVLSDTITTTGTLTLSSCNAGTCNCAFASTPEGVMKFYTAGAGNIPEEEYQDTDGIISGPTD